MTLPRTANAVIIGGGMMGVATAYNLAKYGMKDVVLIEKNTISSGSTGRCAAAFRAQWGAELNIRLGKACVEKYEMLPDELDMDIGLYQGGYVLIAYSEQEYEQFKKNVALQNEMGVDSKLISRDEVKSIVPGIDVDDAVGFSFNERDGHADPMLTCFAHQEAAKKLGVRIEKFTECIGIDSEQGKVKGVQTNRGYISTPIVISAAGAWNGHIGKLAGLNIPVDGERHEILVTEPVDFGVCPTMLMSFSGDYYIQQRPHGSIISGCGPDVYRSEAAEFDDFQQGSSWNFLERQSKIIEKILPLTKGIRVVRQWSGLYDITPDLQPVIGESDELKGFWVNCAGARGFMFGPVAGELVAQQITKGKSAISIDRLHWRRYAEGKHIIEPSFV